METATIGRERTIVFTMAASPDLLAEVLRFVGGLAGGALGLDLIRRWGDRRKRAREEPIELTAKILDDGDELRRQLLDEARAERAEKSKVLERAHAAEMELALIKAEVHRLTSRLERKDEQNKALQAQIIALGQIPVVLTGVAGRQEGPAGY